jgi:outer membrane protein
MRKIRVIYNNELKGRRKRTLFLLLSFSLFLPFSPAWSDDMLIPSLTIEDYTAKAVKEGTAGRITALTLESAGYTREIAFRQTDSPNATIAHNHTRGETRSSGIDTISETKSTTLTLNQPTVLGTNIQTVGTYGDANKPGLTASITQPLYLFTWNAAVRARREAELNFANARDVYDSTVLSIRAQARSLYYNVMLGEESIQVEERKVSSSRKLGDITQALVQAGKAAPVEVMRTKIQTQTDERQLENAEVGRDKAILVAKDFIAVPLDDPIHFVSRLDFTPFRPTLERLMEYAFEHQPQLKTLRRDQELALLAWQQAQEPTRPTLSINSSYGYNALDPEVTHSWTLGGGVSWLFFDSFVTSDNVRIARINRFVADLNLAEAERILRVNVKSAFLDVKNAEKQIIDFQSSREQARHNVDVLRLRFQNGLERLIDVFDGETNMRNLDNEYLGLLVSYNQAKDTLSQLIGGDVETVK